MGLQDPNVSPNTFTLTVVVTSSCADPSPLTLGFTPHYIGIDSPDHYIGIESLQNLKLSAYPIISELFFVCSQGLFANSRESSGSSRKSSGADPMFHYI